MQHWADEMGEDRTESFHIWALRKKCPNTKFFLVCIFPHSDWILTDSPYLSVFSPNAGKYGPEKLLIWIFVSICSLNAGKYGPKKLHMWTLLGIQFECGKIRIRKTSYLGTFHTVEVLPRHNILEALGLEL